MSTSTPLDGQTAIVTGGGWNIGREVALQLARAGAKVAVAGRRTDRLLETVARIERIGGTALSVPTDCTDATALDGLVAEVEDRLGPIDLCCAFAGGGMTQAPLEALPPAQIASVIHDNLLTAVLTARAVLPTFQRRDRGTLFLMAGGGAFVPVLGVSLNVYAAAKAGVCRLVDQLTAENWETGLRFFAIDPGRVPDELRRKDFESHLLEHGTPHPDSEGAVDPLRVAELVTTLHDESSRPLRGRCVSVHDEWWRSAEGRESVEPTIHAYRLRRADL